MLGQLIRIHKKMTLPVITIFMLHLLFHFNFELSSVIDITFGENPIDITGIVILEED